MTITPKFNLNQNETHLLLKIFASFSNINTTEAYVDDKAFIFASKPYFLRLNFSNNLVSDIDPRCQYNADENSYYFEIKKANCGENFENLQNFNFLMSDPLEIQNCETKKEPKNSIEIMEEKEYDDVPYHEDDDATETVKSETKEKNNDIKCIFGNLDKIFFSEVHPLFQIKDLAIPRIQRLQLARDIELFDFSSDHYLSDLLEEDDTDLFNLTGLAPITKVMNQKFLPGPNSKYFSGNWTNSEFQVLDQMKKRRFLYTSFDKKLLRNQFLEVLFSVCYVRRVNLCYDSDSKKFDVVEEENNIIDAEPAAFMLRRLSRSLSWLVTDTELQETIKSLVRRSLTYCVRRYIPLTQQIFKDVCKLLRNSENSLVPIFRCIIEAMTWLKYSDSQIISDTLVLPIIYWAQTRKIKCFMNFGKEIEKICQELDFRDDIDFVDFDQIEENIYSESDSDSDSDTDCSQSSKRDEENMLDLLQNLKIDDIDRLSKEVEKYRVLKEEEEMKSENKPTRLITEID